MEARCCLDRCDAEGPATLRVEVLRHPDLSPIVARAHAACFSRLADPSVLPDEPKNPGSIPGGARCVFCGMKLPIVGRHPLVLDIGSEESRRRYWVHAECAAENFADTLVDALRV